MYEAFFGLNEKPFSIQPDPSFLYWGRSHRLAYAMLEYGVLNHAGISVVTGEVGCGKTTLVHRLLDQLSDTHSVALLSNIQQGRGDLLSWVLMGYGQPFAGKTHVELFSQLQNFFIDEYSKGRRVVLIIDEAQNLSIDMLEELRLLSNINAGKDQLLQLILVGQPQLKDILNRPELLQLAQRVGSDFHLTPLSPVEVDAYIDTRLSIAGARQRIFTEDAVALIAEQSRGVPRVINIIADTALVYAFSAQETVVDADTIRNVIKDKAEYGVFGLPRVDAPAPSDDDGGPTAFVRRDQSARAPAKKKAAPREPAIDDAPRMPQTPPRQRGRSMTQRATALAAAAEPAVVASFSRPTNDPAPARAGEEQIFARDRVESLEDYRRDEAAMRAPAHEGPPQADAPETSHLAGLVIIGGEGSPLTTIASAGGAARIVYVARSPNDQDLDAVRAAGADVVAIADRALSPGRARNAGYRQLKRAMPNLSYVQFVEAGFVLDPAWLDAAIDFMERRPEVAAIEGFVRERFAKGSAYNAAAERELENEEGEIQSAGSNAFVRAEAFEAAGGFRGDLPVNETRDLCVRLRRRGGHIWRLDGLMGQRDSGLDGFGDWLAHAERLGYEYAHGAALHGARPERLFAREQGRARFWGAIMPLLIALGAAGGGLGAYRILPFINPWAVAGVVLAAGFFIYVTRIFVIACRRGPMRASSWDYAFLTTVGHFAEVLGVWRFHFGGAEARRAKRRAA